MFLVPNYTLTEVIQEDEKTVIYRGYQTNNRQKVIIKFLQAEYPNSSDIALLERDYQITKKLNIQGTLKVYCLEKYHNCMALIFEGFLGKTLSEYFKKKSIQIIDFLDIAIQITEILAAIHNGYIIHRNLSTQSIWIDNRNQIKITNFSLACPFDQQHTLNTIDYWTDNLSYISPEQTGRINRKVDYRTDFYSLGVIFYEILTGHLPFSETEPIKLIHSHIAKQPPSVISHQSSVNSQQLSARETAILAILDQIIQKLIAKTAEDRYQSACGLKFDLEKCLEQWQKQGKIELFSLGQQDRTNKLQISQKLCGREQELSQLLNIYERVKQGNTEIVLVSGLSGVGKTALVNEFKQRFIGQNSYFISGKISPIQTTPYDPIIQAFQTLIQQLLTERPDQIANWRKNISAALGFNVQVIVEVIPQLELIVGKQSPITRLPTQESERRFNYTFQQFINVFSREEHPLILFFDDLQWADPASLKLIQLFVTHADSKYLFVIGSFRDDEVDKAHPLRFTLNEISKSEVNINQIFLQTLNLESVNKLIADTLKSETDRVKILSELIFKKTNGNPFFINQILQNLTQSNFLCFNHTQGCWDWQLENVSQIKVTENVADLLIEKINKLSTKTQKILKFAACVGSNFDLNLLGHATNKSSKEILANLTEAIEEGLISSQKNWQNELDTYYFFVHDRIQQTTHFLLNEQQKKFIHLQIGRTIYKLAKNLEEKIFEIVNQYNLGIDLIVAQQERYKLAELNLIAGKKAKASTAYEAASQYLEKARIILADEQNTGDKNYEINLELSECKYLSRKFDEAEALFNLVLQQAKTRLEKAKVYILKINLYTDEGKLKQAIELGLEAIKLFEINLSETNIDLVIQQEIQKVQTRIAAQPIKDLYNLPQMTEPNAIAIMNILMSLASSTYFINLDLWTLLMLKMIDLSLEYGNTEVSSFAYSAYGLLLGAAFENYQGGYEFGKLALAVNQKFNNLALNSQIYFMFGAFINGWKNDITSDFDYLKKSFELGKKSNPTFASYASNVLVAKMYIKGKPLKGVLQQSELYKDYVTKVKNIHGIYFQTVLQQMILSLQGSTNNKSSWNEKQYLKEMQELKFSIPIHFYWIVKTQISFIFEEYKQAQRMAIKSEKMIRSSFGLVRIVEHYFYYALTLLAQYNQVNLKKQKVYRKLIDKYQLKLKKWSDNCPQNFEHKYLLVAAEIARITNQDLEAMDLYDKSIASARENELIQNEAIANELAAKFYLSKGKDRIACCYMTDAYYAYAKWGATAKLNHLKHKYSQLLETTLETNRLTNNVSATNHQLPLDLLTVIKASQTLSGEIVPHKLLEKLMKILIENAGAQKGYLILPSSKKSNELEMNWVIEAIASVDTDGVTFLESVPVDAVDSTEQTLLVSSAVINYVARSQENIVLNNATYEGQFTHDPYIITTQPKSILCTPLLHQGKLSGILYLENNLTTNAFTPQRVEILRILSVQAAISIENSRLYEQLEDYNRTLEQKVKERTQQLQAKNEELANALQKLKSTQTQIIAQEKLASLGALAAGIAHEIKNPLNFVNNFAELSVELSQELHQEIENQKERLEPESRAYIAEILKDISQNAEKINHHGHRADNIVRGMLMLSRGQPAKPQWSDLNALLDESINLAYHGMRAQDPSFQVHLEKNYDQLGKLNIVPSDISRALINIINNACYAAHQRKKEVGEGFVPTISISTKDLEQQVQIRIRDNGKGIPQSVLDKIFNPFFTTKPTGEGTGLGLSISHDIIVQTHQGEMKVESEVNNYTEFIINLPKNLPGQVL